MTALRETDGRVINARTREDVIEALREWTARYGQPTTASFNPSVARWRDDPLSVERYRARRRDGTAWPSLNSIKALFGGSFNDALVAAGLEPNRPGPAPGSQRRPDHAHAPIRGVRTERIYVPSEAGRDAQRRILRAQERALAAEARADLAVERMRRVERERSAAPARTITKVKTVRVPDSRAVERLRAKLADAEAAHRALADQLRAERKANTRDRAEVENLRSEARESAADAKAALDAGKRTSDRLAAATARVERLSADLEIARKIADGVRASAVEADLVRNAEARADAAEVRAARSEREMAEQASAITGEQRRLTADEMAELRRDGPAGPAVMAAALKRLARARREAGDLDAALIGVASAAVGWADVNRR